MDRKVFGARVAELRSRLIPRMSRRQLGEALGYEADSAYQFAYEVETGRRGVSASQVSELARLLKVTPNQLFELRAPQFDPTPVDDITAQLLDAWGDLPSDEQRFILEMVEARRRLRDRVVRPERLAEEPVNK